jgi:hypothetical protein
VKCVWNKNELEELHKRLKKNRDELEWRIMLSLRRVFTSIEVNRSLTLE